MKIVTNLELPTIVDTEPVWTVDSRLHLCQICNAAPWILKNVAYLSVVVPFEDAALGLMIIGAGDETVYEAEAEDPERVVATETRLWSCEQCPIYYGPFDKLTWCLWGRKMVWPTMKERCC